MVSQAGSSLPTLPPEKRLSETTLLIPNSTGNESYFLNRPDRHRDDEVSSLQLCENIGNCCYMFFVPLIVAFGIAGNMCSIKVFVCTRIFERKPATIYLTALSISDSGFLLALLFSWLGNERLGILFGQSIVYCYCVLYVTYVCSFLSVWYIVLIMIDRYIVICHPLKVQTLCSKRTCYTSVGMITLLALILYSQTFITSTNDDKQCSIRQEYIGFVVYFTYIDSTVTFIIPAVAIFILNVTVLLSIKRFKRKQKQSCFHEEPLRMFRSSNAISTAEVRITFMLVVVSTMFLLTNLPSHAVRIFITIKRRFEVDSHYNQDIGIGQIQHICNVLYFSNFAINFILYCSTSARFRTYLCLKSNGASSTYRFNERTVAREPALVGRTRSGRHIMLYVRRDMYSVKIMSKL